MPVFGFLACDGISSGGYDLFAGDDQANIVQKQSLKTRADRLLIVGRAIGTIDLLGRNHAPSSPHVDCADDREKV